MEQRKIESVSGYEYESLTDAARSIALSLQSTGISKAMIEDAEKLRLAIGYETHNGTKEKPCTVWAVENLSELKRRASVSLDTQAGRMLLAGCGQIECELPSGSTLAILPPAADGSEHFKESVKEVFSKLPRFAQQGVTDALFMQLHPDKTMGVVNAPGARIVSVAPYQSGDKLKFILAHEMAHIHLNHKQSNPETEAAADEQAAKWGFPKVRSK